METETNTDTKKPVGWKAWAVGIGMILAAILAVFIAAFDGKDETKVDLGQSVQQVQDGITVIKEG